MKPYTSLFGATRRRMVICTKEPKNTINVQENSPEEVSFLIRRDISERPPEVEKKDRFGDFELDTIVGAGHKGAIVSIVDRASKYVFFSLVPQATAEAVECSITQSLRLLSRNSLVQTMTSDNGKEFSTHQKVSKALGRAFYFAKPYHSWERGLNEHTNGLVRQYFPKGTDSTILTQEAVAELSTSSIAYYHEDEQ